MRFQPLPGTAHSQVPRPPRIIRHAAIRCHNSICLGRCPGFDGELESLLGALSSLWEHCVQLERLLRVPELAHSAGGSDQRSKHINS